MVEEFIPTNTRYAQTNARSDDNIIFMVKEFLKACLTKVDMAGIDIAYHINILHSCPGHGTWEETAWPVVSR